jgi:DNA-directed RNA polymerase specialized sigma24 family protein
MVNAPLSTVLRHLCGLGAAGDTEALSDTELLRRFCTGRNEAAFAALMRRHGRMVWGVCRDVLRHEQDAEDAFQATFLVLARQANSIRRGEAVASWLHGTARRVALAARRAAVTRREHEGWVAGAAFTPDGRTLVTWDAEQSVRLWDVATGEKRKQYRLLSRGSGAAAVAPGGGNVYSPYQAVTSPDGRFIAECSQERFLGVQELASGREVHGFNNLADGVSTAAFTPDGRMLAWGGWRDPTIHLLELATGRQRGTLAGHKGSINSLAFSADGRVLVSGSEDTTAVVWDPLGTRGAAALPPGAEALETCWADLGSSDAGHAFRALGKLVASPAGAVALLQKRLDPGVAPDGKRLAKLITDLDSDKFETRDAAMKELTQFVELAEPALRAARDKAPSAEARRRLEQLLKKLDGLGTSDEPLRASRAVEALEYIGTPEARQLLTKLAGGAPETWLTREAKAAAGRLDARARGRRAAE